MPKLTILTKPTYLAQKLSKSNQYFKANIKDYELQSWFWTLVVNSKENDSIDWIYAHHTPNQVSTEATLSSFNKFILFSKTAHSICNLINSSLKVFGEWQSVPAWLNLMMALCQNKILWPVLISSPRQISPFMPWSLISLQLYTSTYTSSFLHWIHLICLSCHLF